MQITERTPAHTYTHVMLLTCTLTPFTNCMMQTTERTPAHTYTHVMLLTCTSHTVHQLRDANNREGEEGPKWCGV